MKSFSNNLRGRNYPVDDEEFFQLDECLSRVIQGRRLVSGWGGLLLSTVLLGETARLRESGVVSGFTLSPGASLLSLHYSRFLKVADWIAAPPGPRPMLSDGINVRSLLKYGIYLNLLRDGRLLSTMIDFLRAGLNGSIPPGLNAVGKPGFLGIQLLNPDPLEWRLVHYDPVGQASAGTTSGVPRSCLVAPGPYAPWCVEAFLRMGRESYYLPSPGIEPKKIVFTQSGLPAFNGKVLYCHFKCP